MKYEDFSTGRFVLYIEPMFLESNIKIAHYYEVQAFSLLYISCRGLYVYHVKDEEMKVEP